MCNEPRFAQEAAQGHRRETLVMVYHLRPHRSGCELAHRREGSSGTGTTALCERLASLVGQNRTRRRSGKGAQAAGCPMLFTCSSELNFRPLLSRLSISATTATMAPMLVPSSIGCGKAQALVDGQIR